MNSRFLTVAGAGAVAVALVGAGLHFSSSSGGASAVGLSAAVTGAQTVNCPAVAKKLPAVPAQAADEVKRNLALLDTQISEANARLAKLAVTPEGGPNFINNAILGPLKDKRSATLDRIAIAIGRHADKPAGLTALAACTLNAATAQAGAGTSTSPATPCVTQTPKGKVGPGSKWGTYIDKNGKKQIIGDGQEPLQNPDCTPVVVTATAAATTGAGATTGAAATTTAAAPLEILASDCSKSKLPPHTGFQIAPACVSTEFGEVAAQANDPELMITQAPRSVKVGQTFTLGISTKNLVRDRFLGAAVGGYYVESSLLNDQGLVRGHFHTACRMLQGNGTQDPAAAPAFFVATEDGKGGAQEDTVNITVAGMPTKGTAQCMAWAGDGSHRIPMMQNAKQIPAVDVVRVKVK